MATRREARECVVQVLFELDMNPREPDRALSSFWAERKLDRQGREFAEGLVRGVCEHRAEIDGVIRQYAENWDLNRMAVTDRNVLRMALYEMLHRPDIPPVVSINEAVDIARYFNSTESGRFVNGILDRARKDIKRPARTADRPGAPREAAEPQPDGAMPAAEGTAEHA
jgi:transcription antitermination protein NusB